MSAADRALAVLATLAFVAGAHLGCGAATDDDAAQLPGVAPPVDDAGAPPDAASFDASVPALDAGRDAHASNDARAPEDARASDASHGCPVLAYPSGIHVQTYPDATTTATYADHLESGQTAPACFVDVDRLFDPTNGQTYALTAQVGAHFTFEELVGSEITQGYGHSVLLAPSAVAALEAFRGLVGEAVAVNSGFRSPRHQEDVCRSLCGDPLGCAGTCANSSRHLWGDAFDLPLAFYTKTDEDRACTAGFHFAYLESGTHLHVDQNPAYATCVEQ